MTIDKKKLEWLTNKCKEKGYNKSQTRRYIRTYYINNYDYYFTQYDNSMLEELIIGIIVYNELSDDNIDNLDTDNETTVDGEVEETNCDNENYNSSNIDDNDYNTDNGSDNYNNDSYDSRNDSSSYDSGSSSNNDSSDSSDY